MDGDLSFVQATPRGLFTGLVLSTRSLALPAGGTLRQTVETLRVPYLMDPDTAVLEEVTADHSRAAWLRSMPAAAFVDEPPITPAQLTDEHTLELFARAVAQTQRGAAALSAGYFRVCSAGDPWRQVNRQLLARMLQMAARRPVCGWLELPLKGLLNGLVAELARDYQEADYVVLRVAGLAPESAGEEEIGALLAAASTLRASGPRVIVDSMGCYGAAVLSIGAHAFTGGARHHRSVPLTRIHRRPPAGRALGYEVALEWRQIPVEEAQALHKANAISPCGVPECDALAPGLGKLRRRRSLYRHFVHAADIDARFSQLFPPARVATELTGSPGESAQAWGRALARFAAADSARIHSPR